MRFKLTAGMCLMTGLVTTAGFAARIGNGDLVDAAKNQQRAAVLSLLKQHAEVNAPDVEGMTALMWAAHWSDTEMAQALVRAGADPKLKSEFGDTALYEACVNGNAAIVDALLKAGADANATRGEGETALMTASRTGNVDTVKTLIAHGANVNAKEAWRQETALIWAVAENHADVTKVLIDAGADVNAKSIAWAWPDRKLRGGDLGVTLPKGALSTLMYAARQGALEPARMLVEAGADVNYKEPQGYTVLMLAVYNGQYELGRMLVEKGAKTDDGSLWLTVEARDMDKSDKHPAPTDYGKVRSLDMIRILLEHGAPVDGGMKPRLPLRAQFEGGGPAVGSPLYRAARSTDLEGMKLLLEKGANAKYASQNHTTVLMSAAGAGFNKETGTGGKQEDAIACIKLLISQGVDVNGVNDLGLTALHYAAQKGSEKVIEFLAENGAKLDLKDKRGKTAYDIATGVGVGGNAEGIPQEEAMKSLRKLMEAKGMKAGASD